MILPAPSHVAFAGHVKATHWPSFNIYPELHPVTAPFASQIAFAGHDGVGLGDD